MIRITTARRAGRRPVDLNMAPLIDMVFLLLIFFMVTTSFDRQAGIDIDRPTAATAVARNRPAILIAIDPQDRIFMDRSEVDVRAVRFSVERALAENPNGAVIVAADRASSTGTAILVMDACRLAGARDVALAARLPEGP